MHVMLAQVIRDLLPRILAWWGFAYACLIYIVLVCLLAHVCMARKRQRTEALDLFCGVAIASGQSVSSVFTGLESCLVLPFSRQDAKNTSTKLLYRALETETPFGAIGKTSRVHGTKGSVDIYHINPEAMLCHCLTTYYMLLHFLANCRKPGGLLTIILYLDEATPGNQLRPDNGRACQCVFWSILEFPQWFRSRNLGWLPFSYVLFQK